MNHPLNGRGASHDFDFLMGRWRIQNRKLLKLLQGCDEWETFEATQQAWPLPGRIGNYDEFVAESWRPGYVGMALRVFNPETQRWSIYWLTNRNGGIDGKTGALTPPVVGGFKDGIGIFEGRDELEGRPILVRFIWSNISRDSANWEQEFSADDGRTWEKNWFMEMRRVGE